MIRDDIKAQHDKMKNKSPQEKFKYYFYYYKHHVLIAIVVVCFLIYITTGIIQNSKETSIYVALLNTSISSPDEITLMDDYVKSRSIDTNANPAVLDTSIILDSNLSTDASFSGFLRVLSLLDSGELDVLTCPQWVIDEYSELDTYTNLEEALPADLFEKLKEKLYYAKNSEGKEIPVAFYVDDNPKIMQKNIYPKEEKTLLALTSTSKHKDRAVDFIYFLME